MWTSAAANRNIPPTYTPATGYDLVNLYAQYQPTRDLTLNFSVENLLNQYYRPYAIPVGSTGDTQNDVKWASAGPGIVFKGGLKISFRRNLTRRSTVSRETITSKRTGPR